MTHEEFYEYIFNDDFMKPDYKKDIYENIYNEIEK